MKTWFILGAAFLASAALGVAAPAGPHLPKKQDAFFIENDFVYRRFLQLARDGTYRQINREGDTATEVDSGTWEQDADGTVLLHFTRGGLRFHALLSGPLSITLDDPPSLDRLVAAAAAIRRWLAQSGDVVFVSESVRDPALAPAGLAVDPEAESFRRDDLETLARQFDDSAWSEQHRTFRLAPSKPAGLPLLLIQREAVFGSEALPRVQREYHVPRGQPPPFYFVQVDPGTFAREAGTWQQLP